jgi:hypothetical protein
MLFPLNTHTTYIHSGKSFSRAFLLSENFHSVKNLVVFDTLKEAQSFIKILSYCTHEHVSLITNLPQLIDFF